MNIMTMPTEGAKQAQRCRLLSHGKGVSMLCPAKINLTLSINGKRDDGFHDLESVFIALDWYDQLTVRLTDGVVQLECSDPSLPSGKENLVVKAVELFMERTRLDHGVEIKLDKRIPVGGGFGGGSSDAAATLMALNTLARTDLSHERLAKWGAELGSDVPFFFQTPAAICRGRGDQVEALESPPRLIVLLITPPRHLFTADVFSRFQFDPKQQRPSATTVLSDPRSWNEKCFNELTDAAFAVDPALKVLHEQIQDAIDCAVHVTGTGAGMFAIADSMQHALELDSRAAKAPLDPLTPLTKIVRTNVW